MYFSFAKLNNRTFLSVLQLLKIIKSESVEYINGALVIYNLTISSKDDATKLSAYSNQSAVAFINPSLIPMTPEVLQHFNQTVKLACQDGFLPEFHILPQYQVALFHSCQTIGITIDPAVSYKGIRHHWIQHYGVAQKPQTFNQTNESSFWKDSNRAHRHGRANWLASP